MPEVAQTQEEKSLNRERARSAEFFAWLLVKLPQALLATVMALLIVFLIMSVIGRYVMKLGTPWSDEFARVLFAWIVMVGFALAVQERSNVAVDILVESARPRVKRFMYIIQDVLILIFSCVFTYAAYQTVLFASIQILPALDITIGWLYSSCVVAGAMMIIYAIANLIQTLRGQRRAPHYEAGGDL